MHKLFLLSFLFGSLYYTNYQNSFIKNEASNISNLDIRDIKPIFTRNDGKYFYHMETKMVGEVEYTPYTYINNNGFYELKDDLSKNVEITLDNFYLKQNLIFIHYPKKYRFEENRFIWTESTHKVDREFYTQYNFTYRCDDYKYCLNKTSINRSYIKSASVSEGSSEKVTYTLDEQKAKFINVIVNTFSQSLYFKSNEVKFSLSDYIDLVEYSNNLVSFSSRIPLNNIYYWYQGLYPNSDNENESIYSTYAFNTFNDASDIILNKYYEIALDENNSHYSESAYSVNGYLDELVYCNKKYRNIKIYDGYLSKETNMNNEFYLLRLPGSYSDPVAILKEWVPENYTAESYLKEIIKYHIIDNQVIKKCDYSTPISERAVEYQNNHIYDKDTIFLDKLVIKDYKTDLISDIRYNWLSVTYKIINDNGTFKISTTNFNNEKDISFDLYGYYKIVETNFSKTNTLNDVIIKSDDRKLLQIKSLSKEISDDQLNNPSNQIYLKNMTSNDIELVFPYFDSSLINITHNGVEKELFNYVDYKATTNNSYITFPKYTINEIGNYIFKISNRYGLTNTIKVNISNSKPDIKIDADNDKFQLEINTPDGGLNSISSFYLKRAFYKKEESDVQYEQINNSTPYIYEEVRDSTPFVTFSKSKEEFLLNNIFTFYPKVNDLTYYQIIRLYLKDSYGNIIDVTYKWYYLNNKIINDDKVNQEIDVIFDKNVIEVEGSTYYTFISNVKTNIEYEINIVSGENNIVINKEENKITGISIGESKLRFIFNPSSNENKAIKDFKIIVTNKPQSTNKTSEKKSDSNNIILYSAIGGGALLSLIIIVKVVLNKRKVKVK